MPERELGAVFDLIASQHLEGNLGQLGSVGLRKLAVESLELLGSW